MANAAVVECYATLTDPFNSTAGRPSPHRGADYRRGAGQAVVAYEECVVTNSDIYSSFLGYCVTATRVRDGRAIGWAHLKVGTRPATGTRLYPGDQVGIVAGWGENPGSAWSGPHIHTTEDDGNDWEHIWSGQNSDPAPDIQAARNGTAGGGGATTPGLVNYHWYGLTKEAMTAMQQLGKRLGIYGVLYGNGTVDGDFGENSVKTWQELGKRWGYLPGDYEVDGIPHNLDQEAPSNYGYFLQKWAFDKAGYPGLQDGLPAGLTSEYLVKAVAQVNAELDGTPTPPVTPPVTPPAVVIPVFPPAPEGYFFLPDLGSSQGGFDFQEYFSKGGKYAGLKMGGGNASDSPYIAPRYKDQFDRAVAAGLLALIHYWFNGRENGLTPEASADFFNDNSNFRPGDIAAMDIEREDDTDTDPWTVDEAVRYVIQLRKHYPGVKGLFYLSLSLYNAFDWSPLEDLGWLPWIASWGRNSGDPEPTANPTGDEILWQYTSEELVPGNYSGNPKVYQRTDGNLARNDLFEKLGWVVPTQPDPGTDPDPDPVPTDLVSKAFLADYLNTQAQVTAEFAAALK
jgi:hypothetical protein